MSEAPFLLIDAGNSRIKWSILTTAGESLRDGAFEHADPLEWPHDMKPGSVWISNVAGAAVHERIARQIEQRWPGLPYTFVRAQAKQLDVTNSYSEPSSLGSDRWCGMIGAHAAYPGENLLIATFGTATTLEALLADGTFTGGLIAPGWQLMMQSLGSHTAQLPTLQPDTARDALASSASVFATDTRAALSTGCLLAQAGLIERAWQDLRAQWNGDFRLILSGGAASEVAGALKVPHTRHDSLVLAGLALIARENAAPSAVTRTLE
ncbi:MAG: type III pantothenate kinase [Pseudomonadota bacterium]|uniref:Type III pantothenate kinase n=1 Tax=Caballeronia sordidicola TaxID=196367 RepID=A0A242M3P6_CABSO|nr:type III pantothenate kinase [Caballeronia sordidicola]MDP9156473.1 type III pantothenate kinase [Pseudomonadota bacterium]OTP65815.1 Pantothenate kinase type III, CoaX-like protein [Caballeronia sordidicola]